MSRRDANSTREDGRRPARFAPKLAVGRVMPCHAFTDRLLLLARGERIVTQTQLERLLRPDVVFSNEPPLELVPAIRERQKLLGIDPAPVHDAEAGGERSPDSSTEPPAQGPKPTEPATPFTQEIVTARALRREAMRQVADVVERVRAGKAVDLQPVRSTVRHVIESVQRNGRALASLVRLKSLDTYTYTHSINNCVLGVMLAQRSGLGLESEAVGLGALMHDIGKVLLPEDVLHKPDRLTASEWNMIRQHPTVGVDILRLSHETRPVALQAVAEHHERLDGSGYPEGLRDVAVSFPGRIVAITDVYDAMTSDRPYHKAIAAPEAMRWIAAGAGELFDPELVRTFIASIGLFPIGTLVRLSTGEVAIVANVNPDMIRCPTVIIVSDHAGAPMSEPHTLDLARPAAASRSREIVGVENPAASAVDVDHYLTRLPVLAQASDPGLDSLA